MFSNSNFYLQIVAHWMQVIPRYGSEVEQNTTGFVDQKW